MKSKSLSPTLVILVIVIISLLGGFLVGYGTHWGPWADDDSAEYFEAARNLAAGHGVVLIRASGSVSPLSGRTPLYPIFLAVGVLSGADILVFARWMDIVLFVLLILIFGLGTFTLLHKPFLSVALCVLTLVSPNILMTYTSALTEPIFYTFGIACLLLLIPYFEKGNFRFLTIASILAGLAFLSRFSGAIFGLTGVAGLLIFSRRSYKRRIMESAYFVMWSGILFVPWLYGVNQGGDTPGIYNFSLSDLWERFAPVRVGLVDGVWEWLPFQYLLPSIHYRAKFIILAVLCILLAGSMLFAVKRRKDFTSRRWLRNPTFQMATIFILFTIFYALMIALSHVFMVYPRASFRAERHLTPIQVGGMIVFFLIIYILIDVIQGNRLLKVLPFAATIVVLASNIPLSRTMLMDLHTNGKGYTNAQWQESEVLVKVKELPDDITLISNEAEAVVFWTNRAAHRIPEIYNQQRSESYRRFGEDRLDSVQVKFREKGAALILFDSAYWQFYQIYEEEAEKRLAVFTDGLYEYFEGPDGAIYFYNEKFHP